MRKHVFGRQLKRDANERKALFKGLITSLVMRETITTTEAKAKAIKGQTEKLITKAKKRQQEARPFIQPFVSAEAVEKIISNLAPRFADRPGGYTRIVKLGNRFSDNAAMAVIELVDKSVKAEIVSEPVVKGDTKTKKKQEAFEAPIEVEEKQNSKKAPKKKSEKGEKTVKAKKPEVKKKNSKKDSKKAKKSV